MSAVDDIRDNLKQIGEVVDETSRTGGYAIGALFKALLDNGFTRDEAMQIVVAWVASPEPFIRVS